MSLPQPPSRAETMESLRGVNARRVIAKPATFRYQRLTPGSGWNEHTIEAHAVTFEPHHIVFRGWDGEVVLALLAERVNDLVEERHNQAYATGGLIP